MVKFWIHKSVARKTTAQSHRRWNQKVGKDRRISSQRNWKIADFQGVIVPDQSEQVRSVFLLRKYSWRDSTTVLVRRLCGPRFVDEDEIAGSAKTTRWGVGTTRLSIGTTRLGVGTTRWDVGVTRQGVGTTRPERHWNNEMGQTTDWASEWRERSTGTMRWGTGTTRWGTGTTRLGVGTRWAPEQREQRDWASERLACLADIQISKKRLCLRHCSSGFPCVELPCDDDPQTGNSNCSNNHLSTGNSSTSRDAKPQQPARMRCKADELRAKQALKNKRNRHLAKKFAPMEVVFSAKAWSVYHYDRIYCAIKPFELYASNHAVRSSENFGFQR